MMIPIFKTTDGEEHETEAEAKERQALLDAFEAYKEARDAYAARVAQTYRTADGESLDLGYYRPHWVVRWKGVRPTICNVLSIAAWNIDLPESGSYGPMFGYDDPETGVREAVHLGDLYKTEAAAKKEYGSRLSMWLGGEIKRIQRLGVVDVGDVLRDALKKADRRQ